MTDKEYWSAALMTIGIIGVFLASYTATSSFRLSQIDQQQLITRGQ